MITRRTARSRQRLEDRPARDDPSSGIPPAGIPPGRAADRPKRPKLPREFRGVPWITRDGYLDLTRFPIDDLLRRAMSTEAEEARNALSVLRAMLSHGRTEAGLFLLGLLMNAPDDWERRRVIVEALRGFHTPGCRDLLFSELRRVKGSNATRRYLTAVLETLAEMPRDLVEREFAELLRSTAFSPRMRAKFAAILGLLRSTHA